eukprot:CAMPEP_0206559586 /NCGR_PEP_ID=MMETSP0325_2-20121206/20485_1 /ASSEMBLY_ACC=CAM_ASM_000347 /TAXON_ID=2866 /ORGANISM="Crypthecodinium cohnii, Strain Seligo" /LENGTH=82 /DNA_ID=CAMNT_0054061121 /DNA_START=16 /DNA_END=264 /DNA_ORIENTATION=-
MTKPKSPHWMHGSPTHPDPGSRCHKGRWNDPSAGLPVDRAQASKQISKQASKQEAWAPMLAACVQPDIRPVSSEFERPLGTE